MIPRGFTRCDECEGGKRISGWSLTKRAEATYPCPSCFGSGLVPTEKLREEVERALWMVWWSHRRESWQQALSRQPAKVLDLCREQASAVLATVPEHLIRGER